MVVVHVHGDRTSTIARAVMRNLELGLCLEHLLPSTLALLFTQSEFGHRIRQVLSQTLFHVLDLLVSRHTFTRSRVRILWVGHLARRNMINCINYIRKTVGNLLRNRIRLTSIVLDNGRAGWVLSIPRRQHLVEFLVFESLQTLLPLLHGGRVAQVKVAVLALLDQKSLQIRVQVVLTGTETMRLAQGWKAKESINVR